LLPYSSCKILSEYERAVVFRLGRLMPPPGPGLIFVVPILERAVRVDLRTVTIDIIPQDVITRGPIAAIPILGGLHHHYVRV
jgi:regulator of protease activity HflC (stomatin/prohibitin superfamily)